MKNKITENGMSATIEIQSRKYGAIKAVIDAEDVPMIEKYRWSVGGKDCRYLKTYIGYDKGKMVQIYLHRLIMKDPPGHIDHINGNPLDNRKSNLRVVTAKQNMRNKNITSRSKTGLKGVFSLPNGRFRAAIGVNGKTYQIGVFDTPLEAARAYDERARGVHGEFAKTNEQLGLINPA